VIEYTAEHLVLGRGLRYRQQTLLAAQQALVAGLVRRADADGRELTSIRVTQSTNRHGTVKLTARATAR
jgi:hypothetical protein